MERRGGEARPKLLEEGLATQIAELQADLSGQDLQAAARSGSSVGSVKDVDEYRRDRSLSLQPLMKVTEAKALDVQYDIMCEECELCTQPEHTPENLPLLLHQFYCDRVSQLAHLKHMLLVRWARFSLGQPSVTEELQTHFKERMEQLMLEYNDALNRVRCLAVSHDLLLAEKAPPTSLVQEGDVVMYLRWRVYHQHTTKNMAAFLMSIRWVPFLYQDEFAQSLDAMDTGTHATKHASLTAPQSKWLSATKSLLAPTTKLQSHSYTSQFSQATSHIEGSQGHMSLFGGQRGGGVTSDHVTSSVTMASTLRDGGGVVGSNVPLSDVPQHTTDVGQLQSVLQELMTAYSIGGAATFHNSAEQLQLYYLSSRKFPTIFQQQEDHVSLHTFDRPLDEGEAGGRGRGGKNHRSKLTFRKPANWTVYIRTRPLPDFISQQWICEIKSGSSQGTRLHIQLKSYRPTPDPVQITAYTRIKEATPSVDPLLSLCSHCTHLHNVQRVLYALKQHCVAVRHPSTLTPLSVSSHKTSHDSMLVWKCIYSGLDNRNPLNTSTDVSNLELGLDDVSDEGVMEGGPSNQHIGVPAAMKVINDEGGRKVSSKAESVPKDAYFAFLLLRHLRIRDMRIKCLSILNYFRSVERTLTISSEGLFLEGGQQRSSRGRGLLGRRHLANTPVDHVISEAEFMQCMEVENHDDFYSFSEDGHVRVWDQGGVGVTYDVAMEDLQKLEGELLTVGSYYIMKEGRKPSSSTSHNLDIGAYSHQHVDRFAVLLDLWTEEAQFLQSKMKVVNSYVEAYHHVYDAREKQRLAEVITTLLACRPRYSPEASYFITTYHKECQCLQAHYQLVQSLIEHQLTEERTSHRQMLGGGVFGLPPPLIPKQLVSLSGDKRLLIHTYLLEFCNSLSIVASLPTAIQWALSEVTNSQDVTHPQEVINLHHKLLELVAMNWQQRTELGAAYSPDLQKVLFTDICVEDPCLMGEVCVAFGNQQSAAGGEEGKNPKEQKQQRLQAWCDVLQLVSLRHHLLLACSESETLTHLYKQQLASLDLEECHAHLRCVPFDLSTRLPGNKDLDYFVAQAREGRRSDSRLDRYTPVRLHLAVHELDEKHIGTFSFRSEENIKKILTSRNGLEGVRVTLQSQVVHRNTLAVACQQNSLVLKHTVAQQMRSQEGSQFLDSNKSRTSFISSHAPATSAPPITITASEVGQNLFLAKELKKAFVSLQQEKTPVRDHMLAQFTAQPSTALKELEKTKCALVRQFCTNLTKSTGHYSLRTQIIRQYDSLTQLLQDFPATRGAFFILGKMTNGGGNTSQGERFSVGTIQDPRQHRSRPLALLSKDGRKLLNLWYIPHFSEILSWFYDLSVEECVRALTRALHLVSSLHTLLQYLCAHVRLGTSHSQRSHETTTLGGNWGGTEGIGAELQQLQSDIGRLSDPTDPQLVAGYISACCCVLFLKYDVTMRHYLRRTLLSTGNTSAIQTLETISIPALWHTSRTPSSPHISHPLTSHIPAPINTLTQKAPHLFPWQHFLSSHGAFPGSLDHSWELRAYLYVTLAPFNQAERSLANGELLGMSLLLEDVLQHSELAAAVLAQQNGTPTPTPPPSNLKAPTSARRFTIAVEQQPKAPMSARRFSIAIEQQHVPPRHRPSTPSQGSTSSFNVSRVRTPSARPSTTTLHVQVPPLEGAELLEKFLLKTSQLEVLRMEWGLRTLVVPSVSTQQQCALLEEVYTDKVFSWARKAVAKQQLRDAARMQLESETLDSVSMATFMTETSTDATVTPENLEHSDINEMALREAQVMRLLELLEVQMIQETSKHLSKLHHLMLCEGERDDTTLPLDLWRTDSMKEITGLPRSHVVEDFTSQLTAKMTEEGDSVRIPKAHLKVCLHLLSSRVLAREKESYLLYASYYESLLRNQYSQLHQKNQDIEHYRTLAEANARQTKEEALVFMGGHTQNLILEITALRTKISELEEELQSQEKEVRQQVQQEYSSLIDSLFSTSAAVKNRFEDYRAQLYSDMTHSLYEVRQLVAENVVKMKEKLRLQGGEQGTSSVAMVTALKGEGTKVIQDENAQLNKMVVKMRALNKWDRCKSRTAHDKELTALQAKLNALHTKYLELKMSTDEDLLSLQQQVKAMQKNLGRVEQEYEIVKQNLEEERRKKNSSSKSSSKSQETSLVKAGKEQASKIDQLLQELDGKEKQLKSLKVDQDQCQRKSATERSRNLRTLQQMKQQVTQERTLKLDAFHQVDELLSQVHNLETQQHTSLRASLRSIHHTPHASSFSHFPTPSASKPLSTPPLANKLHGAQRPKSQQGRLKTASEQIDLSQEILALKLI